MLIPFNKWLDLSFFLLILSGCDNSLDPLDEERGIYSIYGYLNIMKKSTISVLKI